MVETERTYNFPKVVAILMNRTPMLRIVLALVVGIVVGDYWQPGSSVWIYVADTSLFLLMLFSIRLKNQKYAKAFLPLLWTFFILFGILLTVLYRTTPSKGLPSDGWCVGERESAYFIARLSDTPHRASKTYKVKARISNVADTDIWQPTACDIMLYIQKDSASSTLCYGDYIVVHARPQLPDSSLNPHQFDYRRYLLRHGIGWQCYISSENWMRMNEVPDSPRGLVGWSKILQQQMVRRIQSCHLTPQQQGIAEALLLGWRDDLDESTLQQFRSAGIVHLLCVSGLHVGIVAWLAGVLFLFLGKRLWQRMVKGTVQVVAIWIFVLLTGMAPSTIRAGIMFTLLAVGSMLQQRPNTLNNLCTSALILLMINPFLVSDVGFQLSYAAVLGIIAWLGPLQNLLPIPRKGVLFHPLRAIWNLICLSTAAQMATMPFVLYHFHQFATWFLIANLLIVPFAGLLLATILCMVVFSSLPTFGSWMTWLLQKELEVTDTITQWVASLPYSMLQNIYCDISVALLLAVALILVTLFLRCHTHWSLPTLFLCLLLVSLRLVSVNSQAARQHDMVLYNVGRHLAIECFVGRHSYLICDRQVAQEPSLIDYQRDGMLVNKRISHTTVIPADTLFWDNC